MIALVDYGAGNLTSVRKALSTLGARVRHARDAGASAPTAAAIDRAGRRPLRAPPPALDGPWREAIAAAVRRGHAAPRHLRRHAVAVRGQRRSARRAAAWACCRAASQRLDGDAERAAEGAARRLERARRSRKPARLLDGLDSGAQVYFTHSFAAPVTDACAAATTHANTFASVVERDNVFGVQFHPEKSSDAGLQILRNFLDLVAGSDRPDDLMLTKRIIACLDVRDGQVVKGVQFQELRHAGDPGELARRYNVEGIDEVVILDITATLEKRQALAQDHRRGGARDLPAADRRRRHPLGRGRRRGGRSRRRQGEPQHRGAEEPGAHHHAGQALRQPGGDRGDRRQAARRPLRRVRAQRHVRRRRATPSSGRARPRRTAPARSC